MCPILKARDLSSVVDESVFLKEVDTALFDARARPVPRGTSVADAARWCLGQLSGALLADPRHAAGTVGEPPLTGVFAPVDLDAIRADPACTAEYFTGVLGARGIGRGVQAAVAQGIPDAVSRLDLTTGSRRGLRGRVPVPGARVMGWALEYVPFSLLSGEVGLLFAFTAAEDGPER